jgi:hypothetical protein
VHGNDFRFLGPAGARLAPVLLMAAAALSAGCSSTAVQGSYQSDVPRNRSYTRVLIVGLTPDFNERCAFEFSLASQMVSDFTKAIPSCNSMTDKDKLTRENIEKVVASTQADSVLSTALVSMSMSGQKGGNRDTRGYNDYKAIDYGWGYYGMPVTYVDYEQAPALTTLSGKVDVLSKLYSAGDATLIYSMDIKAKSSDIESTGSAIDTVTAAIADQLRKQGLIH